jgi:hypothetical protein
VNRFKPFCASAFINRGTNAIRARWNSPWIKIGFIWRLFGYKSVVDGIDIGVSNALRKVSSNRLFDYTHIILHENFHLHLMGHLICGLLARNPRLD